jgi:hypothetical protein
MVDTLKFTTAISVSVLVTDPARFAFIIDHPDPSGETLTLLE